MYYFRESFMYVTQYDLITVLKLREMRVKVLIYCFQQEIHKIEYN